MTRLTLLTLLLFAPAAQAQDWSAVARTLGRAGGEQPGGVYKVGFPRGDLHVRVGGVVLKPSLALGSWVAFKMTGDSNAMVMGDLVLAVSEVEPVISKLQEGGIAPTALHNHLLGESPRVMYLHIAGRGSPAHLAAAIHAALALTATPAATPGAPAVPPPPLALDTAMLTRTLGVSGRVAGGVYQVGVPRLDTVEVDGVVVPPAMGVATGLNFQPTGRGRAAVTGDFVLVGPEVNPVLQALRKSGIAVTALHSHLIGETPRLFFMHFWANADAATLARGLRAALDRMNVKKTG